jgi:tRNA pseudouridine38-40 synthase
MLLGQPIEVTGCGRTDTGVNARNFVGHFDTVEQGLQHNSQLLYKLNRFLKKDIFVHRIAAVHTKAHSRFDATSRLYRYYIDTVKNPFGYHFAYPFWVQLNVDAMNQAANKLFGFTDFTSFSKVDTDVKTNHCKIMQAHWERHGGTLVFTIEADRFLRNMVRAIVGTLIEVGLGKLSVDGFCNIIEQQNRCSAGPSVPGNALFLEKVAYPYTF